MSGLAGLLAHHVEPGIYRWHGAFPAADVRHTVEHAGWRFAEIDGWHAPTKAEFLDAIGKALDFPDYYGQNFDALDPYAIPPGAHTTQTVWVGPARAGERTDQT